MAGSDLPGALQTIQTSVNAGLRSAAKAGRGIVLDFRGLQSFGMGFAGQVLMGDPEARPVPNDCRSTASHRASLGLVRAETFGREGYGLIWRRPKER